MAATLNFLSKKQLPLGAIDQRLRVLDASLHSTKGLARPGAALHAAEAAMSFIATMAPGC